MNDCADITLTVNGERVTRRVTVRTNLVDFLRGDLALTGSHVGCEHGVCGACTVRVDGRTTRGCLMLAVQADGAIVETIEGRSDCGHLRDLQQEFHQRNALQCGFCTAGMLLSAEELLNQSVSLTREGVREYLSGNLCRCTGYQPIIEAIMAVAEKRGIAR
jgi:aerobic carbon-monoxide dehydrogenase small subunit